VILCLTRGEGGQNLTGPELGGELGEVRTRELERAAAGYGAEVRFLGAEDFGYSKSLEETFRLWKEEKILRALVREIRQLRPLAVISHWTGTEKDGVAHHQAAGLLARHAFALAGDAGAFPEQFAQGYEPWQPRYLLLRTYDAEDEEAIAVPVERPSPVAGKTYEELGWEAFQSHRSQGLHRVKLSDLSFLRGYYLRVEATLRDGPPAPASVAELAPDLAALPDLFPSVPLPADWRTSLAQTVELAEKARGFLKEGKADEAALALVQGAGLLAALRREVRAEPADLEAHSVRVLLDDRQSEFLQAAAALAGVRLEALTDRAVFTPGEDVWVGLALRVGEPAVFRRAGFELKRLQLVAPEDWTVDPVPEASTVPTPSAEYVAHIPHRADPQQAPFPALRALAVLSTGSLRLELSAPVRGLARARAERFSLVEQLERLDPRRLFRRQEEEEAEPAELEPVSLAPPVTLELSPQLRLLRASPGETTHDLWARVESHRPDRGKTSVWLDVPSGWYTPMPQGTELDPASPATLRFTLRLPGRVRPGSYELEGAAAQGERTFKLARQPRLKGIRDSGYTYKPARARVEVLDIKTPLGLRIGYIGFNDDPVPALLGQLGVGVDMLDEGALAEVKLQNYDAVLIAPRAYDYRKDLADQNSRLLDYVRTGGPLVVELQGRRWDPARYAP
ncbi:MAG: PIG-L family deacetylase, partial [Terriglobia bacterium]